jgi:hypothetical protein
MSRQVGGVVSFRLPAYRAGSIGPVALDFATVAGRGDEGPVVMLDLLPVTDIHSDGFVDTSQNADVS